MVSSAVPIVQNQLDYDNASKRIRVVGVVWGQEVSTAQESKKPTPKDWLIA